jgi:ABC-type enterobactin transport system permease subunit
MTEINTLAAPTNPAAAIELASSMQNISNPLSFILFAAPSLARHRAI